MIRQCSHKLAAFSFAAIFSFSFCSGQSGDTIKIKHPGKDHVFLKKIAIPAAFIGLGIYGTTDNNIINHDEIKEERNEYFAKFSHKADNYLQFAPIGAVYVMDGFGIKGKHNWQQQSILLARAKLIMMGFVIPLKKFTRVVRPDSSAFNSFPSGHTAQAFMAAAFFHKEFGKKYPWATVGMFTLAGSIGVFRMLNNKHWISDVLAGAGFGILSVELSYLLHKNKIRFRKGMPDAFIPFYNNGGIGCTAIFRL